MLTSAVCLGAWLTVPSLLAETTNRVDSPVPFTNQLDDKYKLAAGDRVSFKIIEDKEEAKILVVSDSGELDLPYIGRVMANNKTCKDLSAELKTELEKKYYYQATVVLGIELLSKTRGRVYLVGQIRTAGPQEIPGDESYTLSKAILRAGGFSDFADKKHVKLTRKGAEDKEAQLITVDVSEVLEKGKPEKDVVLQNGDLVYVPARLVNF